MRYEKDGKRLWKFSFHWIDDQAYNQGARELEGTFLGTQEDFWNWVIENEKDYGQQIWDIKTEEMTEEDYKDYLFWKA